MKPKFDPSKPYEAVASGKPKFDPAQPYEAAAPIKDYNSPEALAAEGEATKMAELRYDHGGKGEAMLRGGAQGLSGGTSDEAVGMVQGVWDDAKALFSGQNANNGVTPKYDEFGRVINGQELTGNYNKYRDQERKINEVSSQAHPVAYKTTELGGAVASNMLVPGANTLAGSVGMGALQGAGYSDSDNVNQLLKDTALGASAGAAGYGVGKGIENIPRAVAATKNVASKAGHISDTFTGAAKADEGLLTKFPEWTGIPIASRLTKGGIAAAKEVGATKQLSAEFDDAAKAIQKTFGPGSTADLSQSDILMKKLLEEGIVGEPNRAHQLVASKFAAAHGGDADSYLKLISRSADDLAEAKAFNPISASEEIAPKFEDAYKTLQSESSKRYGQLSDEARSQFQKMDGKPLDDLQQVLARIEEDTTVSATSKNYIREAKKILGDNFADLEPAEQFDRLVAAKKKLKGGSKWASRNEVPEGAEAVRDGSKSMDQYLKALDSRKTADAEWTALSGLNDEFFKKVGIVKNGRVTGIDPIKLETLFSGGKSGRQLQKQLIKAQELIDSGRLPADKVANIKEVLAILKKSSDTSKLSQDMSRFRYKDAGPSSPSLQRTAAIAGKDSAVTTAVRAPQLFLTMKANASKLAQSNFGKPFEQLPSGDKDTIAKLALWLSQNDGASDPEIARKFLQLKSGK